MWSPLHLEGSRVSPSGEESYLTRAWFFGNRKRVVDKPPEEPHQTDSSLTRIWQRKRKMSRVVSTGSVEGGDPASSHSKVLNTLFPGYSCIRQRHQPLPAAATPDDRRYLTSLWVFGNRELDEPESPLPTSFSMLMVDQSIMDPQMIKERITAALKVLSFRESYVLVQFWSPVVVRKRCLLTTFGQPFGLGMVDEGLYLYRLESEQHMFVVDDEYKEKEIGPPGRVYRQKWPEWSFDVHGLSTRQCVLDRVACNCIRGYIDLPVFEPSSGCCVGVLELIMSSNYVDYAFEVREISRALKEENLKSPNVFEDPSFCTQVGNVQHELDEIFRALKMVCDIHKLHLAQTWALSGHSSFVANSGKLEKSCSSFNRSCIGKVCMSTAALPFYVRDLSMWEFHEACRERHLERYQGVVGRALSSRGSCFCRDVTELSEDEYPLVHIAHMNGITSCLAIYLKSVEVDGEYVVELFLPPHSANKTDLQSLLETVKQQIKNASRVQLGITSATQVIGGVPFNWSLESPPLPKALLTEPPESENLQVLAENEQNDVDVTCSKKRSEVVYAEHMEEDNVENNPSNCAAAGTSQGVVPYLEKGTEDFDTNPGRMKRKYSDIYNEPSRKSKSNVRSIGLEEIRKHYGKTMEEAAVSLNVSRSTLKRICRSLDIPRWPYSNGPNERDSLLKSDQTDVVSHGLEGAFTTVIMPSNEPSPTTNTTCVPAALTKYGKHTSTLALQQQEQANLRDGCAKPETTIRGNMANPVENVGRGIDGINVIIKARYEDNIVKFPFRLSDGLVKLEEQVATRFQLRLGSFSLKYRDEEGDMILIACDSDLTLSLCALRQPDSKSVIKLLVGSAGSQRGLVW